MKTRLDRTGGILGGMALLALPLSLLLSGCGGSGGGSTSSASTPTGPAPAQQSSVSEPDHLTFSVTEDKATAAVGEPVTLHIALTNTTSATITDTFATDSFGFTTLDPLLFNSIVEDAEGHDISTNGSTVIPASKPTTVLVTVAPGQTFASTMVYTFVRADTYKVSPGIASIVYPSYAPGGYINPGPLTITVHS